MIPEIGQVALILALLAAMLLGTLPLFGAWRNDATLMRQAAPAALAQMVLITLAFACLAYSFATNDFSVFNVASNSNSKLPLHYRLAATWGSHEGSILLWTLVMAVWTGAAGSCRKNGFDVNSTNSSNPALISPITPSTRATSTRGRCRLFMATAPVHTAITSVHSRIDPSCEPHVAASR